MAPLPRHFSQRPRKQPPFKATQPEAPVQEAPIAVEPTVAPIVAEPVALAVEEAKTPEAPSKPAWSMLMKRGDLLSLAVGKGITVPDEATKAQIIALLDASV